MVTFYYFCRSNYMMNESIFKENIKRILDKTCRH